MAGDARKETLLLILWKTPVSMGWLPPPSHPDLEGNPSPCLQKVMGGGIE